LRKRPILVERGSFRPVTKVNMDMINSACHQFSSEPEMKGKQVVELMEITMRNLLTTSGCDPHDFLARADLLAPTGKIVLISDYSEYHRLAAYLARYTNEPVAVTMGAGSLLELFKEDYYSDLEGGILEAFGKLFTKDLRIYVYPLWNQLMGRLITAENIEMPSELAHLYQHLMERGRIRQLQNIDTSLLHIFSRDVLRRIKESDDSWEDMVPPQVAEIIRQHRLFGYAGTGACPRIEQADAPELVLQR